ncbi:MAG: hypothetical protein ABIJ09_06360 [Pseudomonadota bacterium]
MRGLASLAGVGLLLGALQACDCAGPVHIDDAGTRPRADASTDARVFDTGDGDIAIPDAIAGDTESTDVVLPDTGTALDRTATDLTSVDAPASDHEVTDLLTIDTMSVDATLDDAAQTDAAIEDASATDLGQPDVPQDAALTTDATAADSLVPDSGTTVGDCSSGGLCLLLIWNSAQGDLDLHLSFNSGAWCTDDACYWANCADSASTHVDWDQSSDRSAADPVLFGSAQIGSGPEILRIVDPLQATYTTAVHYQPGPSLPDVTATVELWSLGVKRATQQHTLAPGEFWEIGDITVDATTVALATSSRLCASGQWICTDAVHQCPVD